MQAFRKIKNHSEVIVSGLIGVSFIILSIFMLFNINRIRTGADVDETHRIRTILDLINTFFAEVAITLHHIIGDFPIIASIILLISGIGMFKITKIIKETTQHDGKLSIFFTALSFMLFIFTTVLMYQVYGWFNLLFLIAFIVHMLFNIFNEYFNPKHRKEQYMIIFIVYGIAYFFTQYAVYSNIELEVTPIDVLSVNMFFGAVWILSLLSLQVGVFLGKSKNILKRPEQYKSEDLRRMKKRKLDPNHYFTFSEHLYTFRNRVLNKILNFLEISIPSWLKANYIELLLGGLATIFIVIEFNNRQSVFFEGYFKISQMTHIYEWVNLFMTLILSVLYMFFTLFNLTHNKYYHRQMITIFALWLKVTVSLFITVFVNVELSLFILPFNVLLVVLLTPLVFISIFKEFDTK